MGQTLTRLSLLVPNPFSAADPSTQQQPGDHPVAVGIGSVGGRQARHHRRQRGRGHGAHRGDGAGHDRNQHQFISSAMGQNPSLAAGSHAHGTQPSFFGSHFLMGGERYDVARPDTFLFGDPSDLELMCMNKPAKAPLSAQKAVGSADSVGVLHAAVNIRRDSVKFVKTDQSASAYRVEFIFDADLPCFVQLHFCAREAIGDDGAIQLVSKYPGIESSERYHFERGADQPFNAFTFKPQRYDLKALRYDGGPFFPVVIELRTVPPSPLDSSVDSQSVPGMGTPSQYYTEQVQTTLCSIERSTDAASTLILKPLKQKLIAGGVSYLLQELFGLENKEHEFVGPDSTHSTNLASLMDMDSGGECIICMATARDTVILPCRHCCICNGCAETLRYKLNNCPICRSPFKALLKLKTMCSVPLPSTGTAGTIRVRQEALGLMEALNGPCPSNSAHSSSQPPTGEKRRMPSERGSAHRTSRRSMVMLAGAGSSAGSDLEYLRRSLREARGGIRPEKPASKLNQPSLPPVTAPALPSATKGPAPVLSSAGAVEPAGEEIELEEMGVSPTRQARRSTPVRSSPLDTAGARSGAGEAVAANESSSRSQH